MKGRSIYELVVITYSQKRPQVQYARYLGVVEAASSSLVTQTKKALKTLRFQCFFLILLRSFLGRATQFAAQQRVKEEF